MSRYTEREAFVELMLCAYSDEPDSEITLRECLEIYGEMCRREADDAKAEAPERPQEQKPAIVGKNTAKKRELLEKLTQYRAQCGAGSLGRLAKLPGAPTEEDIRQILEHKKVDWAVWLKLEAALEAWGKGATA